MIGCALSDKMIVLESGLATPHIVTASSNLNHRRLEAQMVEAAQTVQQIPAPNQVQRQSMNRAVRVLAMQAAKQAVKRAIQARGQKLANFPAREITLAAEEM